MSKNDYTPKTKNQFDAYAKAMDAANDSFEKKKKPPAKKPVVKKPAPKKK